jgi:hypothetical protein
MGRKAGEAGALVRVHDHYHVHGQNDSILLSLSPTCALIGGCHRSPCLKR